MKARFNDLIESELMHRLGWTLLHSVWLLALLGMLAIVAMILLRKKSAQARCACRYLGLILMAVAPLAIFALSPVVEVNRSEVAAVIPSTSEGPVVRPAVPRPLPPESISAPTDSERPLATTAPDPPAVDSAPPAQGRESASLSWSMAAPWTGLIWLVGIVILSIWRAGGWWTAQRMRSIGSTPIPGHLTATVEKLRKLLKASTPVQVLQSSLVEVPVVFGWLKPTILLPVQVLESLSGVQLRMVLAHELAHIRRNDYLANLVQTCIETLLFFHPAVWWVSRRIRAEREHCCADLAVQYCGQGSELASALVAVEEGRCEPLPNPALAATGGDTNNRVRRLLGIPSRRDRVGLSAFSILFGVSVLAFIGIAVAEPGADRDHAAKPENAGVENANDPYHVLYDVLMTRYGPDGKSYAQNESSPVILPWSKFPFGDKTYEKFDAALDAFAALPQANLEAYSDIQRALLQRHLWKTYDASHPDDRTNSGGKHTAIKRGHSDRRAAARPKIASLVRRLALTREQILALPNTLAATIKAGGHSQSHDPKDLFKPFLPPDLVSKESSWICNGDTENGDLVPADLHSEKFYWRSAFLSFMRAPGGRAETLKCMEKLNRQEELPVGTQFALIEQAFLISDEGELVLSPLIVSISLRTHLGLKPGVQSDIFRATQCVAEFIIQPRQLMQGHAVMKALTPQDVRYEVGEVECFSGGIEDPFESSSAYIRPRLRQCSHCHGQPSATSAGRAGFFTARPRFLKEGNPEAISKATSARKRDDKTWKALHEFLKADSAAEHTQPAAPADHPAIR